MAISSKFGKMVLGGSACALVALLGATAPVKFDAKTMSWHSAEAQAKGSDNSGSGSSGGGGGNSGPGSSNSGRDGNDDNDDHGGRHGGHGADDGPDHDLNDDKGGLRKLTGGGSGRGGLDDGPDHQ